MTTYSFYRLSDGTFTGTVVDVPAHRLHEHLRAGVGALEGRFDARRQRVENGRVVDHSPARPADTDMQRFELSDGVWNARPTVAAMWAQVRQERTRLLAETDWRAIKAAEQGEELPEAWKTYRQQLRDITLQSDPSAIDWPTKPS